MTLANGTLSTSDNHFLFTANNIMEDAWTNGAATGSGALAMGYDSTIMVNSVVESNTGYLLESGPVVSQSFVGGSAIDATK